MIKILKLLKSYYELDHFTVKTFRRKERYSSNADENIFMEIPMIFYSLTEQVATYAMFLIYICHMPDSNLRGTLIILIDFMVCLVSPNKYLTAF
jgi:hypothetical protein